MTGAIASASMASPPAEDSGGESNLYYFDNASTTFPKPESVYVAMDRFARNHAANPGRGSHKMAVAASNTVDDTRKALAQLFNVEDPYHIVFALNATDALNTGLHGLLESGDHVITSSMEHNSVIRPLHTLRERGVTCTRVACAADGSLSPEAVMSAFTPATRLVVLTHASNVTGTIMPIEEIGPLVRQRGAYFMVDAAQSAGVLDIDLGAMCIDLLAFPGHKGLMGPQGTGGLVLGDRVRLRPLKQGGTGTQSALEGQPEELPEALESGTLNGVGIAGLGASVRFLLAKGVKRVREEEGVVLDRMLEGLRTVPGLTLYGPCDSGRQVGVVSINLAGWQPSDLGIALDRDFDIAVRTGLQCSGPAHRTIGTFPNGTVRVSLGYFTTPKEVDWLISALKELARRPR